MDCAGFFLQVKVQLVKECAAKSQPSYSRTFHSSPMLETITEPLQLFYLILTQSISQLKSFRGIKAARRRPMVKNWEFGSKTNSYKHSFLLLFIIVFTSLVKIFKFLVQNPKFLSW